MLPGHETCKRTIRNQRPTPPVPASLAEFGSIPEEFSSTSTGEPFLIYDNGAHNPNRILAFASTDSLTRLAQADTIFMDGTFKSSPTIFTQIFCMRIPFKNTAITAVYALLPNKSRAVYEELFQAVVDKCEELGHGMFVETVITDFEDSILRSVVAVFGRSVTSRGCFYHLTQSTWRHVQSLGLAVHYKEDCDFRLFCGMLDGLAFLPPAEVQEGMQHLHSIKPDNPPEVDDLLTYFDRTYVSGHYRQCHGQGLTINMRRVPPMFPPEVWNVHDAVLNNAPCTNNICEGWNNKFFNLVGTHHPSVWRVVEWFKKEEATVQTILAQDAVGNPPVKKVRKKFVNMQTQLRNLCRDRICGAKSIPEFLRGVGWNIRLNKQY